MANIVAERIADTLALVALLAGYVWVAQEAAGGWVTVNVLGLTWLVVMGGRDWLA